MKKVIYVIIATNYPKDDTVRVYLKEKKWVTSCVSSIT